ncbi:MAG: methylated-DNA--[protein]-cysteine S-methyltransferase [Bdellovibrionota bacterium]
MDLTFQEMYDAIGRQESLYEGQFITAVKSTGIFCRPSCRARKPLAKNVEFFTNAEEALKHGYRPCKICCPMEMEHDTPMEISNLILELQINPYIKITDADLKEKGLEPNKIRRWFKKNHGMTFQSYQRLIRINAGYDKIKKGSSITHSVFDAGYESLSGFNQRFKAIFGQSPQKSGTKNIIYLDRITAKLGPMFIASTENGICLLEFTDRKMLETELRDLQNRLNAVIVPGSNDYIKQAKSELNEYFEGLRKKFKVSLDLVGTDFQKKVWTNLMNIPYGETRSYQQQAALLGNPKSVRAVANANGMNKIAIIIPCHRVIGSDGSLTGYSGGLPRKKWLLKLEKKKKENY